VTRAAGQLELEGVTRTFGPAAGVFDIGLSVSPGECVCLLGPSGCGKTTLLRLVAGLLQPDAGRILLDGADITHTAPHARGVGFVFQTWALFPHMSVRRNVEFGLAARGVPQPQRGRQARRMLDMVGLGAYAERRPRQLSGGQQQRVALARALAINPRLLLLDEPMSSLDFALRVELRRDLRRLQQELALTALYVTHDYGEALAVADRTVLLHTGRIVEEQATTALFARPRTAYGARFLGLHNLLAGTAEQGSPGSLLVRVAGTTARIPHAGPLPPVGAPVTLCFDQWATSLHAPDAAPEGLPCRLAHSVAEHGTTRLVVRLDASQEMITIRVPRTESIVEGTVLRLIIDWSDAWVLEGAPISEQFSEELT